MVPSVSVVVFFWVMVIVPILVPPFFEKAEMLQGAFEVHSFAVVKVPVARKLPPAVMVISPFLPSVLIDSTSISLLALRVTVPLSLFVDVVFIDPVLMLLKGRSNLASPA
jgi:hypothetical protein